MATILVIDDHEPIRALLRGVLERAGYDVCEANNGREGLALYRARPTDLVITDVGMPEMSGEDVIAALTQQFAKAKVIAMSGEGTGNVFGARQTVQKPFNIVELLHAIRQELSQ